MTTLAVLSGSAWAVIALGLAAGILSALLGVGSGILLVPTLVIAFGLPQKSAQGTALAVMVPMALVGAYRYMANPEIEIDLPRVLLLACGAVVGAYAGSAIVARVPGGVLRKVFACLLFIVAIRMMLPSPKRGPGKREPERVVEDTEEQKR